MKILVIGIAFFCVFCSGIIRHDVPEEKYLTLAKQKQFDCVGQLYRDTTPVGTCILIDNHCVITAAHCLTISDIREEFIVKKGLKYTFYNPYNFRQCKAKQLTCVFGSKKYFINSIVTHDLYNDTTEEGSFYDIALLELYNNVDDTIKPIKLNKNFDELNTSAVGVGFGASGRADKPESIKQDFNKKIAGENMIDKIEGKKYNGQAALLGCDFDHPTNRKCNKMGSYVPLSLEYISAGGDSGGGLFRIKNGEWELIGCCPTGSTNIKQLMKTGYYGQKNNWLRISVFSNWIEKNKK